MQTCVYRERTSVNSVDRQPKYEVHFAFKAEPGSRVSVVGAFNRWNPDKNPLVGPDGSGNYVATLCLAEGRYEYLFVVNGAWLTDPANPKRAANEYGTSNSVVDVAKPLPMQRANTDNA